MTGARLAYLTALLLGAPCWSAAAAAQGLVLPKDCEQGFRRFIEMAQDGEVRDDVTNANVEVVEGRDVHIELVRDQAPSIRLQLAYKTSPSPITRYFDVVAGDHATADDVRRVGWALDQVFWDDPFTVSGLEELRGASVPGLGEALLSGTWRGVVRAFERRMMAMVGLGYTIAVIAGLAIGLLASVALLCGPVRRPSA